MWGDGSGRIGRRAVARAPRLAERQLRVAGARVDEQALALDELLLWVAA